MRKSHKKEKTYAQKITQAKRLELLKKVNEAINHHESMRNSYFWEGGNRSQRKWKERQNNFSIIFHYDGIEYEYRSKQMRKEGYKFSKEQLNKAREVSLADYLLQDSNRFYEDEQGYIRDKDLLKDNYIKGWYNISNKLMRG